MLFRSLDNLDQIFQIKIQNDELCTISYKEEERSEKLNKLLLIISLLSIFQVVEIFFSDKNNIFNISMILIMILLEVFRKR